MTSKEVRRADWRDSRIVKFFLDICIEQANALGKSESSLKKESWEKIIKEFKEKKGLEFTQKQLNNQWNYLRQKYVIWANLVGKSGHGYDPVTHTVTWNQEEWEDYIQKVPEAKQFRYVGLQYADEMRALLDGISATGVEAWGPTREDVSSNSSRPEVVEASAEQVDFNFRNVKVAASSTHPTPPRPEKRQKKTKTEEIDQQISAILETLDKSEGPKIEECNEKLGNMILLQDSEEYLAACAIFCEGKSYRA